MSAVGIPVWVYGGALLALWSASTLAETHVMARVATALLANWCAHMLHWSLTGDASPYWFSILVDMLTAVIILRRPAGKIQALVGWTLLVQITFHVAYVLHLLNSGFTYHAAERYWDWLDWIAVVQIFLVGGGMVGGLGRPLLARYWHRADTHDPSGVV
jgi:FtsH-binding integral membrane protein